MNMNAIGVHAWKIMRVAVCVPQAAAQAAPFCLRSCTKSYLQIYISQTLFVLEMVKPLYFSARPVLQFLILGSFGPVRPAGLDFQARTGPARGRPGPLPSLIRIVTLFSFSIHMVFNGMYCDIFDWRYFAGDISSVNQIF